MAVGELTAAEENFIRSNYGTMNNRAIGIELGRSRNSIIGHSHRLGIIRGNMPANFANQQDPWTTDKLLELHERGPFMTVESLMRHFTLPETQIKKGLKRANVSAIRARGADNKRMGGMEKPPASATLPTLRSVAAPALPIGQLDAVALLENPSPLVTKGPEVATLQGSPLFDADYVPSYVHRLSTRRLTDCQWPIGSPGEPDFHLCGSPAGGGKPYCDHHIETHKPFRPPGGWKAP